MDTNGLLSDLRRSKASYDLINHVQEVIESGNHDESVVLERVVNEWKEGFSVEDYSPRGPFDYYYYFGPYAAEAEGVPQSGTFTDVYGDSEIDINIFSSLLQDYDGNKYVFLTDIPYEGWMSGVKDVIEMEGVFGNDVNFRHTSGVAVIESDTLTADTLQQLVGHIEQRERDVEDYSLKESLRETVSTVSRADVYVVDGDTVNRL